MYLNGVLNLSEPTITLTCSPRTAEFVRFHQGDALFFNQDICFSEIGNQLMLNFVAYLPYQHLYSSPLGPLLPKKHYKGHKLDDLYHH